MRRIYLDNAATTAVLPEVVEAMLPCMTEVYGNASSIHGFGREAKRAMETARRQVAKALNAAVPQEIYFTAGGSESDNWAIKGAAFARRAPGTGGHIITTVVEHHAVLHTCEWLEKQGFSVTYLPVDAFGRVSVDAVRSALRPDTILVSVMAANNEVGTLQPIAEIGAVCRERGVLFHTDAVQAAGAIHMDVQAMNIDLLSLSGHKLHGPKGIGALYIRKGVKIDSLVHGGAQERGFRAGTENLPAIVGMGKAMELAANGLRDNALRLTALRDHLIDGIKARIPEVRLNGHPSERLPNNANLSFRGVEGEALLLRLDLAGVAASSGSACTSGTLDPSHVLLALGLSEAEANGAIRFTLSSQTTREEIDQVLEILPPIVADLRRMTAR